MREIALRVVIDTEGNFGSMSKFGAEHKKNQNL